MDSTEAAGLLPSDRLRPRFQLHPAMMLGNLCISRELTAASEILFDANPHQPQICRYRPHPNWVVPLHATA